jgi:nuclear pore complex protein Nup62
MILFIARAAKRFNDAAWNALLTSYLLYIKWTLLIWSVSVCSCVCLSVCMYVCMYVYMSMYVCMYVCMYYVCMSMYVCLCMYVYVCMSMYVYVCMYVCLCMYVYVCMYVCMTANLLMFNCNRSVCTQHHIRAAPVSELRSGKSDLLNEIHWPTNKRTIPLQLHAATY